MSYGIDFVARRDGEDLFDAYSRLEELVGDTRPVPAAWEPVLTEATAILGDVEVFRNPSSWELDNEELGLQLSVYPGSVSISVAYWHDEAAAPAVMAKLGQLVEAVERITGLEAYDPQLDGPFDPTGGASVLSDTRDRLQEHLAPPRLNEGGQFLLRALAALVFLVLGIVRLATGHSVFGVLFLVIALVNLLYAARIVRR